MASRIIKFFQVNVNRSHAAWGNICHVMQAHASDAFVMLLQEPYTTRNKICGVPPTFKLYSNAARDTHPRAGIICSPSLNMWSLAQFSNCDLTTVLWSTGDISIPEIVIVNMYWDCTASDILPQFLALLDHCHTHSLPIIIGSDTNAHSTLWSSPTSNSRGEILEDLIVQYNLQVLNRGDSPTFRTSRAKSIIDVSLVSTSLVPTVVNWRLDRKDYLSDHKCLRFEVQFTSKLPPVPMRSYGKANWCFKHSFQSGLPLGNGPHCFRS